MNLPEEIKRICDTNNVLLAAAESVTVGNVQALIGSVSGASSFFRGGVTAYNIDQKVGILGVDREHAQVVDCVSSRVAAEMAEGATRLFGVHIAVATTGYAEPPNPNSQATHAYFAIWDIRKPEANPVRSGLLTLENLSRVETQRTFANEVLRELRSYLAEAAGPV